MTQFAERSGQMTEKRPRDLVIGRALTLDGQFQQRGGATPRLGSKRKETVDSKPRHLFQGILREREKWDGSERRKWGQDILSFNRGNTGIMMTRGDGV